MLLLMCYCCLAVIAAIILLLPCYYRHVTAYNSFELFYNYILSQCCFTFLITFPLSYFVLHSLPMLFYIPHYTCMHWFITFHFMLYVLQSLPLCTLVPAVFCVATVISYHFIPPLCTAQYCVGTCHRVASCGSVATTVNASVNMLYSGSCCTVSDTVYATVLCVAACCTVASY